uniref:Zinc finger protein 729 n=1 Tax=Oryzias latipes TaxID=8090 RepID=A0A3P9IE98_ORYLA
MGWPWSPALTLSTLRLLVSPIRIVSAAIWQTVEQKIVSDYGLLEEFVFMVTEIVPQLLSTRQRAELILGLRARVSHSFFSVFPPTRYKFREILKSLWHVEVRIVLFKVVTLLEDCHFVFQDVFPGDFGPTYDKAIQTLMWLFLSRLEKLLPHHTLPQVHVTLMLDSQKDLLQLEDIGKIKSYVVDSSILSALCLPPVERVVIVNEQTGPDAESSLVYTVCTEMEVESENKEVYVEGTEASESVPTQWFGDGKVTELESVRKPNRCGRKKKQPTDGEFELQSTVKSFREDSKSAAMWDRPVRKNRGLKMKRYLSQWRKSGKAQAANSGPRKFTQSQVDLEERTCKVCGKVVSQAKFLQRHMSQHSEEPPIACFACKKFYKSLRYLQQHRCSTLKEAEADEKEQEEEEEFAGDEGEKSSSEVPCEPNEEQATDSSTQDPDYFPSGERSSKGLEQRSPDDSRSLLEGPFYCPHCSVEFKCKQTFRYHLRNICYTEQQHCFRCDECDKAKRFRSYSDLVEHQKKHTKAYPFLCWECGKKFRHGVTLTRHVQRVHHSGEPVTEKPNPIFTCSQCGKTFSSRRCLLKHDNFHHKGMRFPCEFCGKGFFGKDALVRHTLIHTGERPFKCDDCDKSFRSAAELKIHRRYHTGERPFKCNICEKGFVQSCFLTLHMRTHTGESSLAIPLNRTPLSNHVTCFSLSVNSE